MVKLNFQQMLCSLDILLLVPLIVLVTALTAVPLSNILITITQQKDFLEILPKAKEVKCLVHTL